jgi:hypothetical protein
MALRNQVALRLAEMNQWAGTAAMLEEIGARGGGSGDVWFRLGDIYERRLKNPEKARDAYARVPPDAPRYDEAQRRLKRR